MTPLHAPVPDGRPLAGAILAALDDAAAIIDGAGRVSGWNARAAERFGLSEAEAGGRSLDELGLPELADPAALVHLPLDPDAGGGTLLVWRPDRETLPPEALQLQKALALGRLAGPISHELAQPLSSIVSLSSYLGSDPGVPLDLRDMASMLSGEADRTMRMIRALLEVVRTRTAEPRPVTLAPIVRGILELEAGLLINAETTFSVPDSLEVLVDPARLRQVILALTMSAIGAMGDGRPQGRLAVTAHLVDGPASAVRLIVEDSAPVIADHVSADLLAAHRDAARRDAADRLGRRTLDLAVAARLLELDNGRLWHEPLADGNRFVVELPATMTAASRVAPAGAARTVLVCDDQDSIRTLIVRKLQLMGIRSIEACSGEQALALLDDRAVDAVLADQHMARMSGTELYAQGVALRPDLAARFLLMSGDPGDTDLAAFAASAGLRIIAKPFDLEALGAAVQAVVGA